MFGLRQIRQLLLWFSVGVILILVATIFIQHQGKTIAEPPTLSTHPTPNPQAEIERRRLSAQLSQKIFSKFPEAKVELDCFAKGKSGFMDTTGKLVIPLCFDKVRAFSNGVAWVKIDTLRSGYINQEGILVVAPVSNDHFINWSQSFKDFSEDRLPLQRESNGKYGYIDRTGKFVIEPQFDEAYSFHEGRAGVCSDKGSSHSFPDRKCGYIDSTGKVVIPLQLAQIHPFQNGVAVVVSPQYKLGDSTFDTAIDGSITSIHGPIAVNNGIECSSLCLMGVIDRQGQFLVKPNLDFVHWTSLRGVGFASENEIGESPDTSFASGLLKVRIPDARTLPHLSEGDRTDPSGLGKWGFVRKTGGYAIEPRYWEAHNFSADRAVVQIGEDDTGYPAKWRGKWAMIDPTGHIIELPNHKPALQPKLQDMWRSFSEGRIPAGTSNGLYGYMDRNGEWVIEPQFDNTEDFSNGLAAVVPRGKRTWGYIDHHGKLVIPAQFDIASLFGTNGLASVRIGEKWGLIDRQGQYLLKPKYKQIIRFINGIAQVIPKDNPVFYITESGKILPYAGSNVRYISEGLIAVSDKLPDDFKP